MKTDSSVLVTMICRHCYQLFLSPTKLVDLNDLCGSLQCACQQVQQHKFNSKLKLIKAKHFSGRLY